MKKTTSLILLISIFITACGGGSVENSQTTAQMISITDKSISINWDIPTLRDDNSTLLPENEIGGYNIYISTNNNFIPSIPYATVTNSYTSDYIINNLASGTYYIYITTFDSNGDESTYSDPISKTV